MSTFDIEKAREVFQQHVVLEGECLVWSGPASGFHCQGTSEKPARAAWRLFKGELHPRTSLHRKCETEGCVNPEHFVLRSKFMGTSQSDAPVDESKRHSSKISPADAVEIRAEYALGKTTQAELGQRYGITQSAIHRIIRGEVWR